MCTFEKSFIEYKTLCSMNDDYELYNKIIDPTGLFFLAIVF